MWAGGDLAFVVALLLTVAAWLRHEERENLREDARLARHRAARESSMTAAREAGMTAGGAQEGRGP